MQIDLTCPCEALSCSLPSPAAPWCTLTLRNVGERRIASVEVTLRLLNGLGLELTRQIDREFGLSADPGESFVMRVSLGAGEVTPDTQRAEPVIEKVWHEDGTVWRRSESKPMEIASNALAAGRELDSLRTAAGRDAVGYPEMRDTVWLCVCGRPNPLEKTQCARCRRARDEVMTAYSPEGVRELIRQQEERAREKAKLARQKAALTLERISREPLRRGKSRKVRWACACLALLAAAAAAAGPRYAAPALGYLSAENELRAEAYDLARADFESLGAYSGAADRALESRYRQALRLMQGGETALRQAETLFEELDGWQDSADQLTETRYRRALLTAQSRPAEAQALFEALDGYRDSADQAGSCAYRVAENLLASGDDEAAWAAFAALAPWRDSAARAAEIRLRQGRAALDAGETDEAIRLLGEAGGEEAVQLLRRAWYLKGHALYSAGEMAAAGQAFWNASGYLDADAQAKRCILGEARQALDAGDNLTAMELLAGIPGWEDADSLRREAILREAGAALEAKAYDRVQELLAHLPADDAQAEKLRREAVYRPAAAALADEDWIAAAEGFASIEDYSDSAEQLKRARFGQAGSLRENGDLAGAEALYAALDGYADSGELLAATRYDLAGEALESGDWAEAIRLCQLTPDYQDTAERLIRAKQGAAADALAAGRVNEARALYAETGSSEGLLACDWADAEALEAAGETLRAAEAFAALGEMPGAAERAAADYRLLAENSRKTGAYAEAAAFFRLAGDEESAMAMLTVIADQLYAEAAGTARAALDRGEPLAAVRALEEIEMGLLPEKYRDLPALYEEACLSAARGALRADDPQTAWDCLSRVWLAPGADALREQAGWQLLGPWSDGEHTLLLCPDGTGEWQGQPVLWPGRGYVIFDAQSQPLLKLASRSGDRLNLRAGDEGMILWRTGW